TARELWVGFHRKGSGRPSITWPESVAEALCVGWIDGVRRSVDEERYVIRFSPRKAESTWSAVNIALMERLLAELIACSAEGRTIPSLTRTKPR
ncbi:MAG TPA: bacteriocin-protection protein, partial [Gemmatimonadaceae bacterium]|nr:bacteriocin-protection protein [Gemmatimonadaceae bacterium]